MFVDAESEFALASDADTAVEIYEGFMDGEDLNMDTKHVLVVDKRTTLDVVIQLVCCRFS